MSLTLPDPDMLDQNTDKAGSLAKNEPAYLLIGRLQKSHGIKGELAMRVDTDFPERIRTGKSVYLGEDKREIVVDSTRWKGNLLLIRFSGITNPEDASELTNLEVSKPPAIYQNCQKENIITINCLVYRFGKLRNILANWSRS